MTSVGRILARLPLITVIGELRQIGSVVWSGRSRASGEKKLFFLAPAKLPTAVKVGRIYPAPRGIGIQFN